MEEEGAFHQNQAEKFEFNRSPPGHGPKEQSEIFILGGEAVNLLTAEVKDRVSQKGTDRKRGRDLMRFYSGRAGRFTRSK